MMDDTKRIRMQISKIWFTKLLITFKVDSCVIFIEYPYFTTHIKNERNEPAFWHLKYNFISDTL